MHSLQIILWTMAIICLYFFIKNFLIPFIYFKYTFWKLSRQTKKMAKKLLSKSDSEESKKAAQMMLNISDTLKELSKQEKL